MVGSRIRAWIQGRIGRVPAFFSEPDAACEHLAAPHVIGPDETAPARDRRPRHLGAVMDVPEFQSDDS